MDEPAFFADRKTRDAVIRNLLVLGEAVSKLDADTLALAPEIEWAKIRALRNLLVHAYFGIDSAIVWNVVVTKLAPLETACLRIADTLDN